MTSRQFKAELADLVAFALANGLTITELQVVLDEQATALDDIDTAEKEDP
jgi:hypothetical protein